MRLTRLTWFYDFIQILHSIRKHTTKKEYFSKHILFSIISLLQEQKLNPRNYSKPEIVMSNCVQAIEYDVHLYAKSRYLFIYRLL
jgi:hypothetical protein